MISNKNSSLDSNTPFVSIAMITYGHEAYIKQAIEGVLMQECNFGLELIIGDDKSPDSTEMVINDMLKFHPKADRIKYTKHNKNKGVQTNFAWSLTQGKSKYVAICEGDDYWTDPLKLQKQVDFLEANEDFSMACNSSSEVYEDGTEFKIAKREESIIDLGMVLREGWFIRTASIVFRREAIKKGFPDFFYTAYSTDYILQIMILKYGKCKYFPEVMSAYRHHAGGISQANKPLQLDRWITKTKLLDTLNRYTNEEYDYEIKEHQKGIKQTISFYLFRYPRLLKTMGPNFYLKHANPYLFFKEIMKRKLG